MQIISHIFSKSLNIAFAIYYTSFKVLTQQLT